MTRAVDLANSVANGVSLGFKNRIINGAMVIDQRNNGASYATSSSNVLYSLDRWQIVYTQTSKITIQQNAGSVTPPAGFRNYLGVTSSSAYSVLTGDTFVINHLIEGFNVADLAWGTASASTVTLSFWVRSSLTGTFGGAVLNGAANRSYTFSYSISSANTWTQISVTIPGDTTGTWLTNNGIGMYVRFGLGSGSTYTQAANSWGTGNAVQPPSTVSVVGTNGATFLLTGVQLEVGSTATNFEYRDYGRELMMCQRYYYKFGLTAFSPLYIANTHTTTAGRGYFFLPVTMRTSPTSITIGGSAFGAGAGTYSNTTYDRATTNAVMVNLIGTGFLVNGCSMIYGASDGTSFISVDVEL